MPYQLSPIGGSKTLPGSIRAACIIQPKKNKPLRCLFITFTPSLVELLYIESFVLLLLFFQKDMKDQLLKVVKCFKSVEFKQDKEQHKEKRNAIFRIQFLILYKFLNINSIFMLTIN